MLQGLPVLMSMELVDLGSSESKFGASVKLTMLAWASEKTPSSSWINSYVPSTNDVVSICNAVNVN